MQQEGPVGQRVFIILRILGRFTDSLRDMRGRGEIRCADGQIVDGTAFLLQAPLLFIENGKNTRLEIMTEGILTRRLQEDPLLESVNLVILDEFHWNDAQKTWFEETLEDARINGFAVLICRHRSAPIAKYENCPFVSLDNFSGEADIQSLQDAEAAVDAFIANGGEFIMWLGGHHHQDFIGTLQEHPQQVVFNAEASSITNVEWNNDWRQKGTKSQDCFTLIGIDRFEKIVRFIRIGADRDRYERKKESMSINYSTAKMIY